MHYTDITLFTPTAAKRINGYPPHDPQTCPACIAAREHERLRRRAARENWEALAVFGGVAGALGLFFWLWS